MKLQRAKGSSTLSAISPTLKIILDNEANVLDIGCGEGIYGAILTSIHKKIYVDGVDVYRSDIIGAVYDTFYQCDVQKYLKLPNRLYYDMVLALHVLEHIIMEEAVSVVEALKETCIGLPNSQKIMFTKGKDQIVTNGEFINSPSKNWE